MARSRVQFICQDCGAVHSRWSGRCDQCSSWNTLVEESSASGVGGGPESIVVGRESSVELLDGDVEVHSRIVSCISELDRVTGGGFVRGSVLLLGGDPGIGKSTLLLQVCSSLCGVGSSCVYISGEEALDQVRLRAARLGCLDSPVRVVSETNVENILATLKKQGSVSFVVVDSIQTLWTSRVESSPGTVSQVRSSAQAMIRYAKQSGAVLVLVGHMTKEGQIAGPRVVEHMVDAVLYFEGDGNYNFRILRTVKNRFGATDEIGVFEMSDSGLSEATNPSELFMGDRSDVSSGVCIFAAMEGRRPLLVEIQALVSESNLAVPRRAVVGWDSSRLAMILAVLESHCGLRLSHLDIYLNVAGGLRIGEPAADFAVAASLVSSLTKRSLPLGSVWFGEVGLSGHLRSVSGVRARLKEAMKLGFSSAYFGSSGSGDKVDFSSSSMEFRTFSRLSEFVVHWADGGSGSD